jgi:hypothetical protein
MQIPISLETLSYSGSATFTAKRRDFIPVDLTFFSNGTQVELPVGSSGKVGIKVENSFSSDFLAVSYVWTQLGIGTDASYRLELEMDTLQMQTAFANLAQGGTLAAQMEVAWTDGTYNYYAQSIPITILDNIIHGTEDTPAVILDLKATDAQAQDSTNNINWMTPKTTWAAAINASKTVCDLSGAASSAQSAAQAFATSAIAAAISSLSSVYTTTALVATQITTALANYVTQTWVNNAISTAISNLHLGTAATHNVSDFDAAGTAAAAYGNLLSASQKGAVNGVASLDSGGKVPVSQLPSTVMEYLGTWNAATNTPMLTDGMSGVTQGSVYNTSTAGTVTFASGNTLTFQVGDWVIYNGSKWQQSPASDEVISVAGRSGAIVLTHSDITDFTSSVVAASPVSSVSGRTGAVTLTSTDVGLGNVNNTSDANKPVSTATSTAISSAVSTLSNTIAGYNYATQTFVTNAIATANANAITGNGTITAIQQLTQAQYTAITTPSASTLYVIVG